MKNLFALLLTLAAFAASAHAENDLLPPPPPYPYPSQQGSYCSASAADGHWAFSFSQLDVMTNCNRVQQSLYWATRAPITGSYQGGYWLTGVNQVSVQCSFMQQYFSGYGDYPLQSAFNWAIATSANGCLFWVN